MTICFDFEILFLQSRLALHLFILLCKGSNKEPCCCLWVLRRSSEAYYSLSLGEACVGWEGGRDACAHTLFFSAWFLTSSTQKGDREALKTPGAWRLIIIKGNRPVLYPEKRCLGECSTPRHLLCDTVRRIHCLCVFHSLSFRLPQ